MLRTILTGNMPATSPDAGHDIELVLVGQGPLRDEVEWQARKRMRKVIMLENQSREQIHELARSARLYIHGSYVLENGHADALGIAILEFQAVGTPVVAFDSGGVAEGTAAPLCGAGKGHKRNRSNCGFVKNLKEVARDAVAKLLFDPNRWQSFSDAGIRFTCTKFDIARQTRELEDIYDMLRAKQNDHVKFDFFISWKGPDSIGSIADIRRPARLYRLSVSMRRRHSRVNTSQAISSQSGIAATSILLRSNDNALDTARATVAG
jgi:Glycosyl transferases group 1